MNPCHLDQTPAEVVKSLPYSRWVVGAAAVAGWLLLGWTLYDRYAHARAEFFPHPWTPAEDVRPVGHGHAEIDFGGQYVLGRMVLAGEGRRLYHREVLREVVRASYPWHEQSRAQRDGSKPGDVDNMMTWFVGKDGPPHPALGGPLYPPTHACLMSLPARWPAPVAYHAVQVIGLACLVGAGWCLARAGGWPVVTAWPWASVLLLLFPHQQCGLDLGQNQALTLLVLSAGLLAKARGRSAAAGVALSLLAFKPTWAVAFLSVPVILRDWRMLLAMAGGGVFWVALTLPVVGVRTWLDWLEVGRMATAEYAVNPNWNMLSRDLGGLFRRLLVDFDAKPVVPSRGAGWLGGLAVALVLAATAAVAFARRHAPPLALLGFVTLGAYLACFRFVYYDAAIAAAPVTLLLMRTLSVAPGRVVADGVAAVRSSVTVTLVALLLLWDNWLKYEKFAVVLRFGAFAEERGSSPGMPERVPSVEFDTTVFTPSDTVILLVIWALWAVKLAVNRRWRRPEVA